MFIGHKKARSMAGLQNYRHWKFSCKSILNQVLQALEKNSRWDRVLRPALKVASQLGDGALEKVIKEKIELQEPDGRE